MAKGFVRLPRRIFETKWWNKRRVFSESDAIIDLYQRADRMNTITISVRSLAEQWIWEQTKVLRFIERLEKEGFIGTEKSTKGTVITITDFGEYNTQENREGVASATLTATPSATPKKKKCNTKTPRNKGFNEGVCNTNDTVTATPSATLTATLAHTRIKENINNNNINNNNKNIRQENIKNIPPLTPPEGVHGDNDTVFLSKVYPNINFYFIDGELKHPFAVWLRYKHDELKFTYKTQSSIEICYRDLKAKSADNHDIAMAIVEQSVANGWKGLFRLKQDNNYARQQHKQPTDDEQLVNAAAQLIADIEQQKLAGTYSDV